jgi:hypothetical protein
MEPSQGVKPMKRYSVNYEIITDESARYGDAEEHGSISDSDCLRDAVEDVLGCSQRILNIEASDNDYRWITVYYDEDPTTGDYENRDLFFNTDVTLASRKRIAKLLGA